MNGRALRALRLAGWLLVIVLAYRAGWSNGYREGASRVVTRIDGVLGGFEIEEE